ncbi:MAG: hypothetical protein AB7O59_04915 [Pirellulales bacterium]
MSARYLALAQPSRGSRRAVLLAVVALSWSLLLGISRAQEPDPVPPPEEDTSVEDVAPAKPAAAQEPGENAPRKPPAPSSLDDALLNDLDNELLDGAGDLKKPAAPKRSAAKKPAGEPAGTKPGDADAATDTAADPAAPGDAEMIDDTTAAEATDPLARVSQQMRTVEELIPRAKSRSHAQQVQDRIVDDLTRLIEQAETQKSQQSSSSKQQQSQSTAERKSVKQPKQQSGGQADKDSSQPAKDSTNRMGNAEAARPDPEQFMRIMKDSWGHLPPRDRQQMLQNTPDKFLPQYELMIEKYYQRLAEDPARK